MARHHLVPQMYLRGFADDDGMLQMVARDELTLVRRVTVKNACNETGFYSIPAHELEPHARDGHDPEVVEKLLSQVEGRAVPALEEVTASDALPADEDWRRDLVLFASIQMTRTWSFRSDMRELWTKGAKEVMNRAVPDERIRAELARRGKPTRPADIAAFRATFMADETKVVIPDAFGVQQMLQLAVEEGIPELLRRRWHLRVFDEPVLLTSDAPLAMHSALLTHDLAPALKTADAIYWPLGRRHLLSFERATDKLTSALEDKVSRHARVGRAAKVNGLVAAGALRWIFHHPDDAPAGLSDLGRLPARPALTFDEVSVPGAWSTLRGRRVAGRSS